MNRVEAVANAMHSMELEGFIFTPVERLLWERIGRGELPLDAAISSLEKLDALMLQKYPDKCDT